MYPESGNSKNRDQLIQLKTDYLFVCPARRVARAIVANGGNAYMYRFNSQIDIAVTQGWGVTVYHGAELPFVFGQEYVPWTDANVAFSSSERSLSDDVMHAWANFARSGSPTMEANGTTRATKSFSFSWPSFTKSGDINVVFAIGGSTTETGLRKSVCDVWDTLPQPFK
jgi:para-nitrobenzyl esterase